MSRRKPGKAQEVMIDVVLQFKERIVKIDEDGENSK